ncbi:hypothetical protein Tco_0818816 [Tanacetum coccineum]
MSNTNTNLPTQTSNALHNAIMEAGGKDHAPIIHLTHSNGLRRLLQLQKEVQKPLPNGIDNDIYSIVDACLNACEMWKAIERLKQGESINVQDLETTLYWVFGKFTSRDGESLESYYSRFYKIMNELVRNQCDVTNHQVNVQFLLQLQPEWQRYTEQADWRDDTDDEPNDQELKAYYMYMAQIQEVTPDATDNSGPIFDIEPLHKEQGDTNITINSLDMSTNGETVNQDDDDLAKERDLLDSLIEKLKCEIDDNKNRNKFLESSNKTLIDKLKCEIEDFKTKNKSLESSNNHFKEANNELSKTNQLMFKDLKKFQIELDKYHDVNYASKMEIDCAKAKGDLMSYKMESQKSLNEHTQKINNLNQMISEMKKELVAHQETISIMSQEKEAQNKFHKTREDKELEKVIALENKIKILDDIVYKTGQLVQTMNMLNRNCKTSFVKPEFLKKA